MLKNNTSKLATYYSLTIKKISNAKNGFSCLSGVIQKMFWYLVITCLQTITNEE